MGSSRYDPSAYASYATRTAHFTPSSYTNTGLKDEFDPRKITVRESKKSDANPHPTPIIVALDESGSMGEVVEAMRKALGTLFEQIIERRPVSDPHVMAMAVGDMECHEEAPLQVTQFEADPVTIGKQIEDLYLEGRGGGNDHESYLGPLYFAAMKTDCDAFAEGRKGFLFTVGDEEPQMVLSKGLIEQYIGDKVEKDLTAEELVKMIEPNWNYYHLMVMEGSHARSRPNEVKSTWRDLIGERAIPLTDYTKMGEVIVSLIEVLAGRDKKDVIDSWGKGTDLVVRQAIEGLPAVTGNNTVTGPVAL